MNLSGTDHTQHIKQFISDRLHQSATPTTQSVRYAHRAREGTKMQSMELCEIQDLIKEELTKLSPDLAATHVKKYHKVTKTVLRKEHVHLLYSIMEDVELTGNDGTNDNVDNGDD